MSTSRSTVGLLIATGILFLVYPVLRPYSSETGQAGAEAFASPLWLAAHVSAMVGFIVLGLAVRSLNVGTVAEVSTWIGVGLVLPYYGAETFALNVLGVQAVGTGNLDSVDLAEPIRYGPIQVLMFGVGLILVAVGAIAVARRLGGWQSALFAAGFVLFLPQFFAPPSLRVAHGVLILVGAVALAAQAANRTQEISTTTGA